jgi:hypothetical protein
MTLTPQVVPAIKLYLAADFESTATLRELLYGAEEEGVPCEVEKKGAGSALALAYEGALASVLGVGIGVDGKGNAVVHFQKLAEEKPLFALNYRLDAGEVRNLASNAARLVKGIPFIGMAT